MTVEKEDVTFADVCHDQISGICVDDDLSADKDIDDGNKENKSSKKRVEAIRRHRLKDKSVEWEASC